MASSLTLELLDVQEVAQLLRISLATVRSWTSEGKIPYYKLNNRAVRYDREEILTWLESQHVQPACEL